MVERPRVAIVFGGSSAEHGISCLTAASVARAIDPERYEVVGIGITSEGQWQLMSSEQVTSLQVTGRTMPAVTAPVADHHPAADAHPATDDQTAGDQGRDLAPSSRVPRPALAALSDLGRIDVAFALLHGPFGEDGTIQGLFEMAGTRYVGSGVFASAAGMDKHFMKVVLSAAGVPVGPYVPITARQWASDRDEVLAAVRDLEFPVFVKPARGGSSFGINRVADPEHLEQAIEFAQRYDPKVIVEQGFVGARELECGVLEGVDGLGASVVAEIRAETESGFYDFEAKYLPGEEVHADVPAEISDAVAARIQELSIRVFEALECEGLARVDFFLAADGEIYCNEINTMPGFTATSMYPRMWAESGLDYPALVDQLIQQGLRRPLGLR